MVVEYIQEKGMEVFRLEPNNHRSILITLWNTLEVGQLLMINRTNPQSYDESKKDSAYKLVYQIDGPPKFTVGNKTFIRKTGELKLSDGVIEYAGFDLFREVILQLMTFEEAKKIIDSWT